MRPVAMKLGALTLAAALTLPAPVAFAQSPGWQSRHGHPVYGRQARDPRTCVKLCEQDLNPCDPIQFKRTDGRCNPSGTGDPGGGFGGRS